jgi:hypothetical protein
MTWAPNGLTTGFVLVSNLALTGSSAAGSTFNGLQVVSGGWTPTSINAGGVAVVGVGTFSSIARVYLRSETRFGWSSGTDITGSANLDTHMSRPSAATILIESNLVAASTITATNGFINRIGTWSQLATNGASATNILRLNFAATNAWQEYVVATNPLVIDFTNMAAGVNRQLKLSMPASPAATNILHWTNAFNSAVVLPEAITNGNAYIISFDSWSTTTNELYGAGRFFR